MEVFQYAFTKPEWAAWEILKHKNDFMGRVNTTKGVRVVSLDITCGLDEDERVLHVQYPDALPRINVEAGNLPGHTLDTIREWIVKYSSFVFEAKHILEEIKVLCNQCSTPGQIKRVWPELFSFMDEDGKQRGYDALAKSPYPEGVLQWGELMDRWKPASLEWQNDILVQALVLPEYDETIPYPELGRW